MFQFDQQFNEQNDLAVCTHLRDYAIELGLHPHVAFGLDATMEAEQLAEIKRALEEAIAEEKARRQREEERAAYPPCYIGPYSGGFCTICGGRQP